MKKIIFSCVALLLIGCSNQPDNIVNGTLVMGHEVRAFTQDGQDKEYWLIDKSGELYNKYQEIAPIEQGAYIPVHAELKVKKLPKMEDGFGAEYDGTYEVVEILSVKPLKNTSSLN